ncbi:MAG: methyltransferase domain-containing protein [Verrucomicrobiota bacterium]
MMDDPVYNTIGQTYTATRAADPRITRSLLDHLAVKHGQTILDIGAGTGNYSQALAEAGLQVTALEPSEVMRKQGKQHPRLQWVHGKAESLPFENGAFDACIMTLCLHHFADWKLALTEACRVAESGPLVLFTFDPDTDRRFWLLDYFPEFQTKDQAWFPPLPEVAAFASNTLNRKTTITPFPLPPDLVDHFCAAGWRRPEIYLEGSYRAGISSFSNVSEDSVAIGLAKLREDLQSGRWEEAYGAVRNLGSLDVGYVFLRFSIE